MMQILYAVFANFFFFREKCNVFSCLYVQNDANIVCGICQFFFFREKCNVFSCLYVFLFFNAELSHMKIFVILIILTKCFSFVYYKNICSI